MGAKWQAHLQTHTSTSSGATTHATNKTWSMRRNAVAIATFGLIWCCWTRALFGYLQFMCFFVITRSPEWWLNQLRCRPSWHLLFLSNWPGFRVTAANASMSHSEEAPASGVPTPPTFPSSGNTVSSGTSQLDSEKHLGDRQSYFSS